MKARHALLLAPKSSAWVSTLKGLSAAVSELMQALFLIADIIDSVSVVLMLLLMVNWSFAEAAWLALLLLSHLLTGHSNMIW